MLAVVLVNPAARGGTPTDAVEVVRSRLGATGVNRVVTLTPASAAEAERELAALLPETALVVVIGGDGTVNIAVNVLAGTRIPLGIVPVGSGNDFASAFGIAELDTLAATEVIAAGITRTVDLASVTRPDATVRKFASVFASGFDSLVNDRANNIRWPRGHMRYNLAIAIEFFLLKRVRYVISWVAEDGTTGTTNSTLLMTTVANTATYGGGVPISPKSDPADGMLELIMVKPAGRLRLLRLLNRVFQAKQLDDPLFSAQRVTSVTIDTADTRGYADGDPITTFPAEISVDPGALTLIVPAATLAPPAANMAVEQNITAATPE